ncbi:uncharacterized protein LOC144448272 [Glandiceps talaboti]
MSPLRGPRYRCQICPDFDLCEDCFEKLSNHPHSFMLRSDPDSTWQVAVVGLPLIYS